ncbi:hypothetical protein F4810DRAFT_722887 [Camillea tinctor]|nr:hypothetical protein F4810DRAFT_722887 [Camillea tinctor]
MSWRKNNKSGSKERHDLSSLVQSDCYLDIFDIPILDNPVERISSVRKITDLAAGLDPLRMQGEHTIRIIISELPKYTILPHPWGGLLQAELVHGKGFKALMAQWRTEGTEWCELEGFQFLNNPGEKTLPLQISHPDWKFGEKWTATSRKLLIKDLQDGRGIVFVSCVTFVTILRVVNKLHEGPFRLDLQVPSVITRKPTPFVTTEKFTEELLSLANIYGPLMDKRNWKQVFALRYYHANLNVFADLLHRLIKSYPELEQGDLNPEEFKLRQWRVREITNDSYQYQQFKNVGNEMTMALESLLDVVGVSLEEGQQRRRFAMLRAELQGSCRDVKLCVSRLSDDLEHDLKFLDLSRNVSQAIAMETRFKDLGPLIYDFFGVLTLIATFVLILLAGLLGLATVQEQSVIRNSRWYSYFLSAPLLRLWLLVYGLLMLSSFLVGMFKDVALGAKIFGFGTAAILSFPWMVPVTWIVYSLIRDCMHWATQSTGFKARQQKQRDPESHESEANQPVANEDTNIQSEPHIVDGQVMADEGSTNASNLHAKPVIHESEREPRGDVQAGSEDLNKSVV